MIAAPIQATMPHTLFPTAFGTCGIAWNDTGLTGFQLPEATDALTEQHIARKGRSQPADAPPRAARGRSHSASAQS